MQDLVMDILRVLAAPDIEVRRKTLNLAMDLVSSRNIEEMVLVLKKEISKTHNIEHEDTGKYRQLLVRTLHSCCIRVSFLTFKIKVFPLINQMQCFGVVKMNIFEFSSQMLLQLLFQCWLNFYPTPTNKPLLMCLSSFVRQFRNSHICVR